MFAKVTENGTKKPSVGPGNRVPMVKVLNYLKKVRYFFVSNVISLRMVLR